MRHNISYNKLNVTLRVVDYAANMLLPFLPLVALSTRVTWPLTRIANYSGDIILGAVFPIHERSSTYECGRLQDEGIQQLEALLFTLKKINADPSILPGIKIGVLALDSCDSTAYALQQTMDFIKGFIARNNEDLAERQYICSDGSLPKFRDGSFDRIAGIIGGQSSAVSIQLANLLRLFKVPQISYLSTSPTLSNKHKYDYFFRTVPSDVNQVQAILEILREFRWTYVSVVYSDTDYGNRGYEQLQEIGKYYNICFSSPQSINVDHFSEKDYENVIKNLMHKINAKVVVVFADKQTARNIMSAAKRRNAINRFIWIGSDAWCCRNSVVSDIESVVEGAITVSPLVRQLHGFNEYFTSLSPKNNQMNPWFVEFWEDHFHCKIADFPSTPYNEHYVHWCPESKQISASTGYRQTPTLHFVRDAAYAFAYALHEMHRDKCNGVSGLCPQMRNIDGFELRKYIEKVTFKDENGKTFRFLPSGDAPPRYSIINFQRLPNNSYIWRTVGTYMLREDGDAAFLDLDRNAMRFKRNEPAFPRSYCSEPCKPGQAKLQLEGDTCCWLCTNCSLYQYLPDEFHCEDCPLGSLPNSNKTNCEPIPEAYLSYSDPWAIVTMAFAGFGILVTGFVAIVFWVFGNTPIIKAAGRELSYLLLSGIMLSFMMTFIIISKPTAFTCGLTKFFLGFCYALNYSAIVTKTNRIARIFKRRRTSKKLRYTSPQSQLVITALLVSIEALINTVWLIFERPKVEHVFPTREENVLICHGSDNTSYLIGLIYPSILIAFCTAFAFKTRKCPEGFNEARYLTFTNYTTCVIWLAFLPLFVLSTSTAIRAVTLSLLLSLSGSVQLCCLFIPKVYIALLKPEKNTKENVMCSHHFIRSHNRANVAQSPSPTRSGNVCPPSIIVNGGKLQSKMSNNTSSTSMNASTRQSMMSASTTNFNLVNSSNNTPNKLSREEANIALYVKCNSNFVQSKTL